MVSTENCVAQPAQNVDNLRQQIQQLQNQLNQLSEGDSVFGDQVRQNDTRVKSIGRQRSKKAVELIEEDSDALLIRLYDLSDIFVASPNYPAKAPNEFAENPAVFSIGASSYRSSGMGGGMGGSAGGSGGVFSFRPAAPKVIAAGIAQEAAPSSLESTQVSLAQLVAAIKQTVSPQRWGDGDDGAKIQFLGNTLLITATNDMHQKINNLLNLFRSHWGKLRTISIQTYWVRAEEGQAKELLTGEHQEAKGAGVVDPQRWKEFIELAESEKRLAFSATLTGHNNQTLYTLSGRQRQLVVGAVPIESRSVVKSPEGNDGDVSTARATHTVGFQPVRQTVHDGAAIQVTPLATRGGNFVVVDLHAKVNEFLDPAEGVEPPSAFAYTESGEKVEVTFDSTDYVAYRMSTTIRCPKEQMVLAGSMTFDSNSAIEQPNLYVFVKATVHTITEDKSDWKAEESDSQ